MTTFYWFYFISLLPSIVLHEVSHGWVADFFGDHTAREQHRLSLNPVRHLDPFGSVLMPLMLVLLHFPAFGYAKPVPVNPRRLRNQRKQMLWVALAGPAVNIVLSAIGFAATEFAIHSSLSYNVELFFIAFGLCNLVLAAFNLLPIPPLDGSAIIERFIPNRHIPRYYHFRARALPFFFIFLFLDFQFLHVGTNLLPDLEHWWLSLLR
jgi:Zn-dependent protease